MKHIGSLFNKALQDYRAGRFWPAEKGLRALLKAEPGHAGALGFLGALLLEQGKEAEGFRMMERSLRADPRQPDVLNNYGYFLRKFNRFDEALEAYDRSLLLRPSFVEGLSNRGDVLFELGRYEEAEKSCELALAMNPSYSAAWYNLGNARQKLDNHIEAVRNYSKAITYGAVRAEVYCNMGNSLRELGRFEEALTAYAEALRLDKSFFLAWYNQGVLLHSMRRYEEALISYRKGLELNGEHAESYSDLGATLFELGRPDEALDCYNRALELKPDFAHPWQNRGMLYDKLKRYDEALACHASALALQPDLSLALGNWIGCKTNLCDWDGLDEAVERALRRLEDDEEAVINPLTLSALVTSQNTLCRCSRSFTNGGMKSIKSYPVRTIRHERIRIGYLSSDFRMHPVSFLTAGLFEQHDRREFEIFGFGIAMAREDAMRKRVMEGFEHFIDIGKMDNASAYNEIRKYGLNIAVDLNGHTALNRIGLFKNRIAPVQVNYLGFPGTMGADFIDYIIGDRVIIPEESQSGYSEKVVCMPHTFQVNDAKREIAVRAFSRAEFGLPEKGFVFCSFHTSYKITPAVFGIWMGLLDRVKGSVLWLVRNPDEHVSRLQAEARRCGIDPERLVFAEVMPYSEHLARYALADLVLDTSPFGGGTTTSDALWAGVPVLTLLGQTFVGRMSASLLKTVGLPEMVTESPEAYARRAVELAENPAELAAIRAKLAQNRTATPLFDTALFARDLEKAYRRMWDRHLAGLPPDHIEVKDL